MGGSFNSTICGAGICRPAKLVGVEVRKSLSLLLFFSARLWGQEPFQIHGYIQGRFTNQEGTPDRLEIRRARVILSGNPISQLSYAFQADLVRRPFFIDMAVQWKFSRAVRATAGQFKMPFSAESLIPEYVNIPIVRARAV